MCFLVKKAISGQGRAGQGEVVESGPILRDAGMYPGGAERGREAPPKGPGLVT